MSPRAAQTLREHPPSRAEGRATGQKHCRYTPRRQEGQSTELGLGLRGMARGLGITVRLTHPDVLQVEGKVPDEGLNQPLLHPEIFLYLFKGFILQL